MWGTGLFQVQAFSGDIKGGQSRRDPPPLPLHTHIVLRETGLLPWNLGLTTQEDFKEGFTCESSGILCLPDKLVSPTWRAIGPSK